MVYTITNSISCRTKILPRILHNAVAHEGGEALGEESQEMKKTILSSKDEGAKTDLQTIEAQRMSPDKENKYVEMVFKSMKMSDELGKVNLGLGVSIREGGTDPENLIVIERDYKGLKRIYDEYLINKGAPKQITTYKEDKPDVPELPL